MKPIVFVPSHITGFFQIIRTDNPLKTGSRGAGVVLERGVKTGLKITRSDGVFKVRVNGKPDVDESVSRRALEILRDVTGFEGGVKLEHRVGVPIGSGFGTSAACALGSVLGVVRELGLPITMNQASWIAHMAEVELGTGLGDVIAEVTGGLVLRLREGPPGHGETDRIMDPDLYIITETLGELDTSSIIQDPMYIERINRTSSGMIRLLLEKPDPQLFMKLSHEFAERTGLLSGELMDVVNVLSEGTLGASMAMLGNTAFALSRDPDAGDGAMVSRVDFLGARFIH